MSWNFLISFAIGLGVYLAILGIIGLVKYFINKRKAKKIVNDYEVVDDEANKD